MRNSLLTLTVLTLLGGGLAEAQQSDAGVLRAGDLVRVSVWREPTLSGEFVIAPDGSVSHPLYRDLNVTGMSLTQIESAFRTTLSRLSANPQFVVEPLLRIAVSGEVRMPNLYTVPPLTTVAQAIALAGGTTEYGKLDEVVLYRDRTQRIIDLTDPTSALAATAVQSGDQILIKRRTSFFRDYIAPAGSVVAALAAVINIILSNQ